MVPSSVGLKTLISNYFSLFGGPQYFMASAIISCEDILLRYLNSIVKNFMIITEQAKYGLISVMNGRGVWMW